MKRNNPLMSMILIILFSLILPTLAQTEAETTQEAPQATTIPTVIYQPIEPSVTTNQVPNDLNAVYLIGFVIALLISRIPDMWNAHKWAKTLESMSKNENLVREAELRYANAGMTTQSFVKVIDGSLKAIEQVAINLAPGTVITELIDKAEDFTNEITDGIPLSEKPPTLEEADKILYGDPQESKDPPPQE